MPRLRLFANLREIAGVSERSIDGATVGEVLERASSDYGEAFTTGVAHSRVWVNGDPASADTAVAVDDEIAVIPPVSGGAIAVEVPFTTRLAVSTALLGALLIGNAVSFEAFVVTFVGVAAVWVWDLAGFALARGVPLNIYPMLFAVIAPAWGAYRWGFEGFAFAAMAGVAVVLVWALFDERFRQVESLSVTMLGTMLVATGAGPMVLLRGYGEDVVSAYIVVVIGALIAALLVTAFQYDVPFLDVPLGTLIGAVIAGAVAAAIWGDSFGPIFISALFAGGAIVAGRAIGSLLRSGQVLLADPAPGYAALLDGAIPAAGLFFIGIALFV